MTSNELIHQLQQASEDGDRDGITALCHLWTAQENRQRESVCASFSYSAPDGIVHATTTATVKAVEVMDDGVLHVVIDHWPR